MQDRSRIFFMLVVALDSIGLGVIIPVLPTLVREIGHVDVALAAAYGGGLAFAYAVTQFFCAPVVGALSDRYGRRVVLLAALAAFGLDYGLMALAPTLWLLLLGRIVSGVTGATYSTASAAMADITAPEDRAKSFGLIGLAFGIGFIVGPLLGGFAGGLGPRAPFVLAALLALANFIYGYFFVPETLPVERRRPFSLASVHPLAAARAIGRRREIRGTLVVLALWQMAFTALPATWSYFTIASFSWNSSAIGFSLAYSGLTMAVVQGGLVGRVVKALGEKRAAIAGLGFGTAAYAVYACAHAGWILYVGMTLWALGGLVAPSCNALMSRRLGADRQGELQGYIASTASLASIVAPVAMTQLFYRIGPAAPWIASALLAGIAVPVVARGREAPGDVPAATAGPVEA